MRDTERIRVMSRLAVYDKNLSEADRRKSQYFRHDYIYRQNFWLRLSALVGSLILILFYFCYRLTFDGLDVLTMDYQAEISKLLAFILVVMVFYTFIGTVKHTAEYERAQKRINGYYKLLERLEAEEGGARRRTPEKKREVRKQPYGTYDGNKANTDS